jgi:hypothetical protein
MGVATTGAHASLIAKAADSRLAPWLTPHNRAPNITSWIHPTRTYRHIRVADPRFEYGALPLLVVPLVGQLSNPEIRASLKQLGEVVRPLQG